MSEPAMNVFHPAEGALLDLESLAAIPEAANYMLGAALAAAWPGATGLVIEGLELDGEWAIGGPPGTRRPDGHSKTVAVSSGRALVTSQSGRRLLLEVHERLEVRWPTDDNSAVEGALVLVPQLQDIQCEGELAVARKAVRPVLGFVKREHASQPHLLPLAMSVGNGRDWATDQARLWQPEHPAVAVMLKQLEQIEKTVWNAEPQGSVWNRGVLGRNWVRYQTIAAASLQAAQLQLEVHAMTTWQRVRLLAALHERLRNSVEPAAAELIQMIGPREGAGLYARVGAQAAER
ncbi:MAG: hypothetical protein ABIO70_20920 [Pseudomonadota bacterium]